MKRVPGKTEQLWYWPILRFYIEILGTHKKINPAFKGHLGFDRGLGFGPRSFVQKCNQTCQTCLGAK
jgi:hypothetical protein